MRIVLEITDRKADSRTMAPEIKRSTMLATWMKVQRERVTSKCAWQNGWTLRGANLYPVHF
jgi:hypothetical protein